MFVFTKEYILKKSELKQKSLLQKKILLGGSIIALLGVALIITIATSFATPNAYAVLLNGQQVAVVEDNSIVEEALDKVTPDCTQAQYLEKLEIEEIKAKPDEFLNVEEVQGILAEKLTWTTRGAVFSLNGEELVVLENVQQAEQLIEQLKETFHPNDVADVANVNVVINDNIEIQEKQIGIDQVCSLAEAKKLLLGTQEKIETYTVKEGDNLWTIARQNNMRVADIKMANPDLTTEKIDIGQVLKLTKAQPLINVTTTYEQEVIESIPYSIKTENDSSILRGQSKVKQPGKEGEKQVEYKVVLENGRQVSKEVLQEKVLKEPVEKVVVQGTRLVVASRGSGQLSWPLRGSITSSYGKRGREFHTGMDINGNTGDPIRAAESGKVTQAGWVGNYGYMVTIDHGGGLVTRYAHCSKILVSVGDKVDRGATIARVGSTGRSTGSHLHFEVIVNGSFKNPRSYL
jgi:murein DD-endopeptidase MepM/ murein hydrolase activator NlpD